MRSNTKQALLVTVVGVTLFVALLRLSDVLAFAAQLVEKDYGVVINSQEVGEKVFASLASLAAHIQANRLERAG